MSFSNLGLSKPLLDAIREANFDNPFSIQTKAIPAILQKKDLWALAPTGSGKTAAYVLPILDMIQRKTTVKSRAVAVLVLVPTSELALQVDPTVKIFAKKGKIHGGVRWGIHQSPNDTPVRNQSPDRDSRSLKKALGSNPDLGQKDSPVV